MQSYRLLLLDKHGRLLESRLIVGDEDWQAMAAAEDEVRRCEYVEVWKGGRPIGICARPLKQAFRRQSLFRCWRRRRPGDSRPWATDRRTPDFDHEAQITASFPCRLPGAKDE